MVFVAANLFTSKRADLKGKVAGLNCDIAAATYYNQY